MTDEQIIAALSPEAIHYLEERTKEIGLRDFSQFDPDCLRHFVGSLISDEVGHGNAPNENKL